MSDHLRKGFFTLLVFALLISMGGFALETKAAPLLAEAAFTEDFETDGNGTRYTVTEECTDGGSDFFTRTDGLNIGSYVEYFSPNNSYYWAAMDTDGDAAAGCTLSTQTITWTGIDITGYTSLGFSGLFAEDDSSDAYEDWDDTDYVYVEVNIDGGGYQKILQFAATATGYNSEPKEDTDFDGFGDGIALAPTFAEFTGAISGTGSTLDLRITTQLDSGDEDVAFDLFTIGEVVVVDDPPTVSSTTPADTDMDVALDANIEFNFSEDVTATGSWFDISCASSGTHTAAVTGGIQNYVLNPDTDFSTGEVCTVTVYAAQVADQDGTVDNMAADYVFSFTAYAPLCGTSATLIHDIQGSGADSPEEGNIHTIEGVVVGDFQTGDHLSGFFVQEEDIDADGDTTTSEGIFVYDGYTPAVDVNIGDIVRVDGTVDEQYGLTQLESVTRVEICSAGGSVTAASVALPVASLDVWEYVEGMLVNIPQTLYATDNYNQGRYGEVGLSGSDRLYNPTNVVAPGAAAIALQAQNDLNRIQLEDGSTASNPVPVPYIGTGDTLRTGDTLSSLTGVINYAYSTYEIHPVAPLTFSRDNVRTATPSVGGAFKVASFNVLNYFSTLDDSGAICGPASDQDCRGADDAAEFTRQRDKIIAAIIAMDADVIGLMELENHATDDALTDLVSGLNDVAGAGTYAALSTGTIGTDAIKVAFIYKTATALPSGAYAVLDATVDATFNDDKNRPALAQTFTEIATGEKFTAAVNHLKSKGSDCDDLGDPDTGDGQGNCNLTRTSAATALVNWLATDPTSSGDADFLIIGDLNSYAMEDPITAVKDAGYTDLLQTLDNPYSYVYYGQAGYLDHALANANMESQVTGVTSWHINTDEPSVLDYNDYNQAAGLYTSDQYRASDHDPIIIGLNLVATTTTTSTFIADFDGDGTDDIAVFRSSNSTWYIRGVGSFVYGAEGDIPVPADYDGDGSDDIAVFRPSNGTWYVRGQGSYVYGEVGDIPVPADYDGDGTDDIAVFRSSNGTWYLRGVGSFVYGAEGDTPVPADYDGDGKADIAVFRATNSTWYIRGIGSFLYGEEGDIPVSPSILR